MTYLSDRARSRKSYKYYISILVLFILFLYAWPTIQKAVYPHIEKVVIYYGGGKSFLFGIPYSIKTYFTSRISLEAHNKELSLTIERLENEIAEKNGILKERGLEDLGSNGEGIRTLVLYPLLQDFTHIYSTVILSKGFKDGLEENKFVYIHGREPVCIIKQVYDSTSLCALLTADGNTIEGVVASSTTLFMKGNGGGTFVADIPKEINISIGDQVFLKSDQSMLLGTVADIVSDDPASSWHIFIRGMYNPVTTNVFYVDK